MTTVVDMEVCLVNRRDPSARTPLIVVTGLAGPSAQAVERLAAPPAGGGATVVVRHDLAAVDDGLVGRTLRTVAPGRDDTVGGVVELEHGCLSCALRDDLLPLLRALHRREDVGRIVLALDQAFEAERVCFAIEHTVVGGPGMVDAPAARDVEIVGVVGAVDARSWVADALGDEEAAERGIGGGHADDERTVAQLVVGHVEFADVVLVTDAGVAPWGDGTLAAIVRRLAPTARVGWGVDGVETLLRTLPADARRGAATDPHGPLLRGTPPLESENGVVVHHFTATRPFHPTRLHEAVDVLLDGVVAARGRVWVAAAPDSVLWLESAGGGMRFADVGRWLAAMRDAERDAQRADRLAFAALRWHGLFGDRHQAVSLVCHGADPAVIDAALREALLDDAELALGERAWRAWPNPFGEFHTDPCRDDEPAPVGTDGDHTDEER